MPRTLLEPPARLPVSLLEARAHQRLAAGADDDELTRAIVDATAHVQNALGLQLVAAKWQVTRDRFPANNPWPLYPWPLLGVDSIAYTDGNGDAQTLDSDGYQVDTLSEPGRIAPAYGTSWPAARQQMNSVTVDMFAGCAVPITDYDESTNAFTVGVYVPPNGTRVWLSTDDTLPEGLAPDRLYFIVSRDESARTIKLSATSGGSAIDITDSGTGQHWLRIGPPDRWEQSRRAILLLCDHWWEHRGDQVESSPLRQIEHGVQRILNQVHNADDFPPDLDC